MRDNDDKQELNMTQPFEPGGASTPHPRGEQIEMQTMQLEQTGLPSYAETSFGGDERTPLLTDDDIYHRLALLKKTQLLGFLTFQKSLNQKKTL